VAIGTPRISGRLGVACGHLLHHLMDADGAEMDELPAVYGGKPAVLERALRRLLSAGLVVISRDSASSRVFLTRRARQSMERVRAGGRAGRAEHRRR